MSDNGQPSFYAIIPADVRYNKNLCANAKLMYGEITALTNSKGYCWANNEYFANLYDVSLKTVSRWISQLESEGYIKRDYTYKKSTKEIQSRMIRLGRDKNVQEVGTKMSIGGDKKEEDNNTLINNTLNINNLPSLPRESKKKSNKYDESNKYYQMAQYMYGLIKVNNETVKEPNYQTWADEFRKIIEIDKREAGQLRYVLLFSQKDSFWQNNILSPSKLRKQYSTLYGRMKERNGSVKKQNLFNPWEENQDDYGTNQTTVLDHSEQLPSTVKQIGFEDIL